MKRKVSEFAYGFVLTHELIQAYGYLPTVSANEKSGSVHRGYPLFLHFKASEYMKRRNAGESKLVGLPNFRFALHRKTQSNQHQLLTELEKKGNAVFYATPKIHEALNLNGAFFDKQVVDRSLFVSPCEIGEIEDNEDHRVIFSAQTQDVYFCPQPRNLGSAIHGEDFADSMRNVCQAKEADNLDEEFFRWLATEMVSLVSPNHRIFDELSRGKLEMGAATFANYLAKTLFDCELLIIPAAL